MIVFAISRVNQRIKICSWVSLEYSRFVAESKIQLEAIGTKFPCD